jgi:hypothetical protein
MGDIETVITQILGAAAFNVKKTEVPVEVAENVTSGATPSCPEPKASKMYYGVYRGLGPNKHMQLH